MLQRHHISRQTLIVLSVLCGFYVLGDLMTTVWLINNHPTGIQGESNPLGVVLFNDQGFGGLLVTKVAVFIAVALTAIMIEARYADNRKMMRLSHLVILGLMAWSILVVTNNVLVVYTMSLQQGTLENMFLFRLYVTLFSITLVGLIGLPFLLRRSIRVVQAMLAVAVILGPLAFSPQMYEFLFVESMMNLIIYIVSMLGITALMLYSTERLYTLARAR